MCLNLCVHIAFQYVIIFFPSYWFRLAAFCILGLCQLKNTVCYVWIADLVPSRNSNACSIAMTSNDAFTLACVCFYFLVISRNWFPLFMMMTVVGTIALLVLVFVVPESPANSLHKGRVGEAIEALNLIGRINGMKARIPKDAVFQEAVTQGRNESLVRDNRSLIVN